MKGAKCQHCEYFYLYSYYVYARTRERKIITTDTGYEIPTVLYHTNTVFSDKPGNRLPTGRK